MWGRRYGTAPPTYEAKANDVENAGMAENGEKDIPRGCRERRRGRIHGVGVLDLAGGKVGEARLFVVELHTRGR